MAENLAELDAIFAAADKAVVPKKKGLKKKRGLEGGDAVAAKRPKKGTKVSKTGKKGKKGTKKSKTVAEDEGEDSDIDFDLPSDDEELEDDVSDGYISGEEMPEWDEDEDEDEEVEGEDDEIEEEDGEAVQEEEEPAEPKLGANQKKRLEGKETKGDKIRRLKAEAEAQWKGALEDKSYTWKKAGVHPKLLQALTEKGFKGPTPVQRATLGYAMKKRHIIAAAQTGSGKTLAFGIPLLHHILTDIEKMGDNPKTRLMSCLAMTPTRELTMQIREHLDSVAKHTTIRTCAIVGGMSEDKQSRILLRQRPHIVVATPGRLAKLLVEENIDFLRESLCYQLRYLVVDEGDRMLDAHHFTDLNTILDQLNELPPDYSFGQVETLKGALKEHEEVGKRQANLRTFDSCFEEFNDINAFMSSNKAGNTKQIRYIMPTLDGEKADKPVKDKRENKKGKYLKERMVFITSATLTLAAKFKDGTKKLMKYNPGRENEAYLEAICSRVGVPVKAFQMIDINPEHKMAETMQEVKVDCLEGDKDQYLYYLLKMYEGRTIIFVNAITCLRRVTSILHLLGVHALPLHAQMEQRQRLKNLDRFKADDKAVIVATDVVGRGLDIPNVLYVIHYQFPRNTEIYTHRCGRTARAQKAGMAISIVSPSDAANYKQVMFSLGYRKGLEALPIDTYMFNDAKPRIRLAIEIDYIQNQKNKKDADLRFFQEMSEAMDMDLDESLTKKCTVDPHEKKQMDKKTKWMMKELEAMCKAPLASSRGAYLGTGANQVRQKMHQAAASKAIPLPGKGKGKGKGKGRKGGRR